MEAYLDNAATTQVSAGARQIAEQVMAVDYGNPSSLHKKGMEAERYIRNAREGIAKTLKAQPKEIVFTSGGTESNNMALFGAAMAKKRLGKHIITTQIEHASIHSPLLFLKEMGFEIDFAPVDPKGHVIVPELLELVRKDTILVSIMYVNNEIGAVEDIAGISAAVKRKKPDILFHTDAVQAYGKYRIVPKKEGIDLLSASGHKIHAPKGSGFLYIKDGVNIKPILYGGGQQKGRRSGTENVPAIAGLGQAAEEIYTDYEQKTAWLYELKRHMAKRLEKINGTAVHALTDPLEACAPHIISASFSGVRSEVLLHALEEKGIYVSSGSACASNHPSLSGSLKAIGASPDQLESTLRFSFCANTKMEEIDYAADQLEVIVPMLQKYTRH